MRRPASPCLSTDLVPTHRFYGFAIGGPATHLWYTVLERAYGPSRSLGTSLLKMGTDQIVAAPVFTAMFFAVNGVLEAKPLVEVKGKMQRDLWGTLKVGCECEREEIARRDSSPVVSRV